MDTARASTTVCVSSVRTSPPGSSVRTACQATMETPPMEGSAQVNIFYFTLLQCIFANQKKRELRCLLWNISLKLFSYLYSVFLIEDCMKYKNSILCFFKNAAFLLQIEFILITRNLVKVRIISLLK